jgi:sarcosine oxidase
MVHSYEYIVLGLGGIGSAATYWLARRAGRQVLGLEQFELGHSRGGSQDHSRIIRLSYHTPGYVELAKAAYQAWAELEADAQESLILKTGGLDLFPAGSAIPAIDYQHSLETAGVPFEWLEAAEVMRRWPQFRLNPGVQAIYQAESGIVPAARCNAIHQRLAQAHGATLRDKAPVTGIRPRGNEIELVAGSRTYRCQKLIIAAGAWTNAMLAHFDRQLPLTVTQEQVVYYQTPQAADFAPSRFPIWIWMDEPCFYGFPVFGEAGPKVSQDVGGRVVTADKRSFAPDPQLQARIDQFVFQTLPTAFGPPILIKTCLYTMPPDRDFVLDSLPHQSNVAVAVGAGHAFKFASLLGRILSELAIDGHSDQDLTPFRFDRPILLEDNPATSFLI